MRNNGRKKKKNHRIPTNTIMNTIISYNDCFVWNKKKKKKKTTTVPMTTIFLIKGEAREGDSLDPPPRDINRGSPKQVNSLCFWQSMLSLKK